MHKRRRETWEKSAWEKCENKRGLVFVVLIGVVLVANALIQISIVGAAVMAVIALAFYQAVKFTRILILISAVMAPISNIIIELGRNFNRLPIADYHMRLPGLTDYPLPRLVRIYAENMIHLPAYAWIRPVVMAVFLVFTIYAIFIDKSTRAYLKNIRGKRRAPFKKENKEKGVIG